VSASKSAIACAAGSTQEVSDMLFPAAKTSQGNEMKSNFKRHHFKGETRHKVFPRKLTDGEKVEHSSENVVTRSGSRQGGGMVTSGTVSLSSLLSKN